MGLWPAESDENSFRQKLHSLEAHLFPLSPRTERSAVERSAVQRCLVEMSSGSSN
jgi:hypothetical protein